MTIKNILVYFDATEEAHAALSLALQMSRKYGAHVTGLIARGAISDHVTRYVVDMANLGDQVRAAEESAIEASEKAFAQATTALGDKAHWSRRDGRPDQVVAQASRYYDVVLIGQYDPKNGKSAFSALPDNIALQSGRPLIVVPKTVQPQFGEKAVVAWDGQRASARALSDAMQILETKTLVTILTVGRGDGAMEPGVNLIREHLSRHGVKTEWARLRPKLFSVADAILEWCVANPQDLLVMGAYEHSKFREDLVGGVTNSVLRNVTIPVLLAH